MEDEDSDIEIREEDVIQRARERLKSLSKLDLDTMTERKFRSCLAEDFDVDDLDELKQEIGQEVRHPFPWTAEAVRIRVLLSSWPLASKPCTFGKDEESSSGGGGQ